MSNEKITELLKGKNVKLISIIILILIVLLFVFFSNQKTDNSENLDAVTMYVERTEKELSSILSKVEGAGEVSVLISVESGMETVLAKKTTVKENNGVIESEETPLVVNGKTVTIKENYPKIIGVLIVAEGANSLDVKLKLQSATLSFLNISINQIEILTSK